MATAHARLLADRILEGQEPFQEPDSDMTVSSKSFKKTAVDQAVRRSFLRHNKQSSSSSYVLADDHSQFSRDIEHWMNGSQVPTPITNSPTAVTNKTYVIGPQGERPTVQRSTLVHTHSLEQYSGIWYVLAMILPLFSLRNCPTWRCTPSVVVNSAEVLLSTISRVIGNVRAQLRQMSHDQVVREVFATFMDVILVIYAVGFLILSMYQASILV
ncbi:hypothetical protein NE865_12113 [Phthorimaea operculella]|nr:hypothetical protein NE865_12113 [Phthorimaea operculella]